jgi:hypothetical protein
MLFWYCFQVLFKISLTILIILIIIIIIIKIIELILLLLLLLLLLLVVVVLLLRSRGSSVSIMSGYGLDDRVIEVRSPARAKDFSSSLCVQTGSGAHPTSCTMGTGGPASGGKARPGRDADHSPPSRAEVTNE